MAEDNRRIGAVAAFGIAAMPVYFIVPRIVGTALGAQEPTGSNLNAEIALTLAYPNIYASLGLPSVIVGASFMVLALALHGHLRATAPFAARVATAAGVIGGALFFLAGFGPLTAAKWLVELDAQGHAAASAMYVTNQTVTDRLTVTSVVLFGAFALIASLAGARAGLLPRALSYLGVLFGITAVVLNLPHLALAALWFVPIPLMLVWAAWLGVALLRGDRRAVAAQGATSAAGA